MSNAIVPVIPKRNAVTGTGYPTSLTLGELAVNTTTGSVYLGADPGVVRIGVPVAAGTTLNLGTGDGSTVAFTITGGTGTDAGGYLVSVGGIDQPSGWTVAGTTLTFSEAPPAGAAVSVRAILKGEGGGGGGTDIGGRAWAAGATYTQGDLVATSQRETWICIQNANTGNDPATSTDWWAPQPADAVSLQLRAVSTTAPTDGQVLMWSAANNQWEPTTLAGGSVTFNTQGTHYWRVPAYTRYARVQATAGSGTAGTNGQGTNGENGGDVSQGAPTVGANGADGYGSNGTQGRSITFDGVTVSGGAAGQAGSIGYGGGGGGGYDFNQNLYYNGAAGNGPDTGAGGLGETNGGLGGAGGGGGGNGQDGNNGGQGGTPSGNGGGGGNSRIYGGGGGGAGGNSGGGGGGGGLFAGGGGGYGGGGGTGSGATAGGTGETLDAYHLFTPGALVPITISAGAGTASITITY